MASAVDSVLAGVRGLLTSAGLSLEGQTLTLSRLPEQPPLGTIYEDSDYPLVTLEPSSSIRGEYQAGKTCSTAISLSLSFVAHASNLDAHPTIRSPWEYARKGVEAVNTVLREAGADWGLEHVILAEWQESGFDTASEEQGLFAWSTTWRVEYGA